MTPFRVPPSYSCVLEMSDIFLLQRFCVRSDWDNVTIPVKGGTLPKDAAEEWSSDLQFKWVTTARKTPRATFMQHRVDMEELLNLNDLDQVKGHLNSISHLFCDAFLQVRCSKSKPFFFLNVFFSLAATDSSTFPPKAIFQWRQCGPAATWQAELHPSRFGWRWDRLSASRWFLYI